MFVLPTHSWSTCRRYGKVPYYWYFWGLLLTALVLGGGKKWALPDRMVVSTADGNVYDLECTCFRRAPVLALFIGRMLYFP